MIPAVLFLGHENNHSTNSFHCIVLVGDLMNRSMKCFSSKTAIKQLYQNKQKSLHLYPGLQLIKPLNGNVLVIQSPGIISYIVPLGDQN